MDSERVKKPHLQRLYALLCAGMAILVLVAFLIQIQIAHSAMLTHTTQLVRSAHEQSEGLLLAYFNELETTFLELGYSPSIQDLLEESPETRYRYNNEIRQVFSVLSYLNPDVASYAIYDREGQRVISNALSDNYKAVILADRIELPQRLTYDLIFPPNQYIGISLPMYVISFPVIQFSNQGQPVIGALVMTMELSSVENLLGVNLALEGCSQVITDEAGAVLASAGPSLQTEDGLLDRTLLDSRQLVLESTLPGNGWKLYSTLETGVVSRDMLPLFYSSILIWLLVLFITTCVLIVFQRQVLRPIRQVSHFMRHASDRSGQTDALPLISYQDKSLERFEEFYSMEQSLNQMLGSLHRQTAALLEQEKQSHEAELLARQMEILAYRSQINPHFLYNTLDCIRGIAMSRQATEIMEITQSLSMMFRYVIKGGNFATIEEELGHLAKYSTIIHYRFMGRITIQTECAPDIGAVTVPRMIVQPLVENAVFHGLEGKLGPGLVRVRLYREGSQIHVQVSDNGLGMTEEALAAVKANLSSPADSGQVYQVGLANIAHRLRLYYPGAGGIHITSRPGEGTLVELILDAATESR